MLKGKKMLLTFVASAALVGGVFAISQSKVDAKSYSKAVTKIAGNGNYAIYHNVSKKGPSGAFSNTKYFKHFQIPSTLSMVKFNLRSMFLPRKVTSGTLLSMDAM